MSKAFCISYDLKHPDADYAGLFDVLKGLKHWWHYLESTWLVVFDGTPEQLWERLKPHVQPADHLLVIGVTPESTGWLPEKAWNWIEQNVDAPQMASA